MKIGIIGTRGVPNHYGGFEQFAEYLSQYLAGHGHEVTVYNSHTHPYQEKEWNGVEIKHCYDPEDRFGTIGQFLYDLNCIRDCRKNNYDIILQLGYTSNSVWSKLLPKNAVIITNMDGLEWKRSKYKKPVQRFLQFAEKLAVRHSHFLIADSIGIQQYLNKKYNVTSAYIPYGANPFQSPKSAMLKSFGLEPFGYNMLIARLEPENSIETILDGVRCSAQPTKFLVIGNAKTRYGAFLRNKFKDVHHIVFLGTIYDINILNNLRHYSINYFHGHTVGGTNPSLLEAMASGALICAHNNIFNKSILQENAYYFKNKNDIASLLDTNEKSADQNQLKISNNYTKIRTIYSWDNINQRYMDFMLSCLKKHQYLLKIFPGKTQQVKWIHKTSNAEGIPQNR
jgi:glycosyltransferase involved in cell wall biosynthesis